MAYDPALPTTLDRIRLIVGDTSNDPDDELFPDETYLAKIAEYTNWKHAAADMAEAAAIQIEQDPTGFTAVGDMSISWSDRTRSLRTKAARLRADADQEEASGIGKPVRIRQNFLTGSARGGQRW